MDNIKIFLFDVDGVLIRLPHYYTGELELQGYENAAKLLNPFYKESNIDCLEGKSNAAIKILPFLEKIGWESTAENYFNQQFQFEKKYLDKEFISLIRNLQHGNIKTYLCTDQEGYRAKFLLEELDFQNIFDGHFISCNIGFRKCDGGFWLYVLKKLKKAFPGLDPFNITFIDDIPDNIESASKFGINTILFKDRSQIIKLFS